MKSQDDGAPRLRVLGDLVAVGGCAVVVFALALHFQIPHRLAQSTSPPDGATSDAVVLLLALVAIALIVFVSRRWRDTVRQSEKAEARRALYDPLTGLPNRILLHERVTEALAAARQRDGRIAVLFLDLDRFKSVNDNYGHAMGDHLLTAVADRLREAVRGDDLLARLGGDEFVVICHELTYHGEAETIAERILLSLAHPFFVKNGELTVTTSIGIALSEQAVKTRGRKESAETLMQDADAAMYRAKAQGPGRYAIFDRSMKADRVNRDKVARRLEEALARKEFRLHYQPIITVDDEQIVGIEALIRWEDPKRGMVMPGEFVSQLEDTGLIVPVGEWALEEACRQVKEWDEQFPSVGPLRVSVNVSPRQLMQAQFGDVVTRVLRRTGTKPTQLCLEITEAALMGDVVSAWSELRKVKAQGVSLAIDDFGTGYSSVSYVRNFALDALKIDQSFVRGLSSGIEDTAIVKAVIHMAHALGLETVAEGVETDEQLAELRSLECDKAQGYLFSRPQPPDVIAGLLATGGSLRLDQDRQLI